MNAQYRATDVSKRDFFLADYHQKKIVEATEKYLADYEKSSGTKMDALRRQSIINSFLKTSLDAVPMTINPSAISAGILTTSKIRFEAPTLNAPRLYGTPPVGNLGYDAIFSPLVPLHFPDAQLDASSINLMKSKTPQQVLVVPAQTQNAQLRIANAAPFGGSPVVTTRVSNQFSATPSTNVLENFQNALALDTVRNEYRLHVPIHKWFADGQARDFDSLNAKIYTDLFWTSKSDPWLGLSAQGAYSALDNDGVS